MEAIDKQYYQDQRAEKQEQYQDYLEFKNDNSQGVEGCPDGCTEHKPGCDIKGNISFDTGEKIYHMPGQEYYAATQINPQYGERWFCTEAEARANGWRKSYK